MGKLGGRSGAQTFHTINPNGARSPTTFLGIGRYPSVGLDIDPDNRNIQDSAFDVPNFMRVRGGVFTVQGSSAAIETVWTHSRWDACTIQKGGSTATIDHAATLNVLSPVGGLNITVTNAWAAWFDGRVNIDNSDSTDYVDTASGSFHTGGGISADKGIWTREEISVSEMGTAPASRGNTAKIFAEDNGSGKTRLMVQFGSGAAQQIAIEP